MPAPIPDALKIVSELAVEKFARFARLGADPASITYAVIGSPLSGASHVSVTLLSDEAATSCVGLPDPLAGRNETARTPIRDAVKHEAAGVPARHAATSIDVAAMAPAAKLPKL